MQRIDEILAKIFRSDKMREEMHLKMQSA